jgi:hypothetical protein
MEEEERVYNMWHECVQVCHKCMRVYSHMCITHNHTPHTHICLCVYMKSTIQGRVGVGKLRRDMVEDCRATQLASFQRTTFLQQASLHIYTKCNGCLAGRSPAYLLSFDNTVKFAFCFFCPIRPLDPEILYRTWYTWYKCFLGWCPVLPRLKRF